MDTIVLLYNVVINLSGTPSKGLKAEKWYFKSHNPFTTHIQTERPTLI
jgi:hypothetical protein